MAQKKFGTFGGVFTPSILTILGVIMYMRLPWIVGQAGLFTTIGIILIAHIVSVTTGLSVSSISTDKKVKAGGTYYIISRSLGLPIGGTLGIALFFGLSFSVSLYIIGFSESFLGFWDFPIDKNTIRLTGTIALLIVATLTFISTSLAIKTQYFIMTAIFLSLITIIFGKHDFAPTAPLLNPVENSAPIILLFAIFFPAVTGFEAGVSMSGDLQNPKKSIPIGTISAILIGLLVYIGLAVFFALSVSSDQLINNPNILLDISFFPPLLVAGIWGATISSAIGSILGAPRILQATSSDQITPKIFSKGFGPTNEPRNALILTFFIAEAGILIGELNLIARVVSMFFITTYGFLNLSSTIEKLASTDFRPSFKIPVWVSIVGATVSIILMLELDFIALIGAIIIMGSIFLYLKRKELTLESGDTWEGVWASLLRSGLNKLNRAEIKQRNWRPNIILFSGGIDVRPHLIEFGRWLVKKKGILSNFNLVENKSSIHLIKLPKNIKETENQFEGIFTRQLEVNDIYDGMETITKLYGFAGIEPNTVMLGWARESKNPLAFSKLLRVYQKLDYNIFILDYDKEKKFGQRKTIDLWWRGSNNNATLALTIIKFLQMEDDWDNSITRIFIITNDSSIHNRVYKNVTQILEEQRISAEVRIINNVIENKAPSEIIKLESKNTDLVILGLPEIDKQYNIIENTDKLINDLNTVLLIHASSFFIPIYIGIENTIKNENIIQSYDSTNYPQIELPKRDILAKPITDLQNYLKKFLSKYENDYLAKINSITIDLGINFCDLIEKSFNDIADNLDYNSQQKSKKNSAKIVSNYLFNSNKYIQNYINENISLQSDLLEIGINEFISNLKNSKNEFSEYLVYEIEKSESNGEKFFLGSRKSKKIKISFERFFDNLFENIKRSLFGQLEQFGISNYQIISDVQKLFNSANDSFIKLESILENEEMTKDEFEIEQRKIENRIVELKGKTNQKLNKPFSDFVENSFLALQKKSTEIESEKINKLLKSETKSLSDIKISEDEIFQIPQVWTQNQNYISNFFLIDIYLKNFLHRINIITEKFILDINLSVENNYLSDFERLQNDFTKNLSNNDPKKLNNILDANFDSESYISKLTDDFNQSLNTIPQTIEILDEDSFQNLSIIQFEEVSTKEIYLKQFLNNIIELEILEPIQNELKKIEDELNNSKDIFKEIVRFSNFSITQLSKESELFDNSNKEIRNKSIDRIVNEIKRIEKLKLNYKNEFSQISKNILEKLNPYLVSKSSHNLKSNSRVESSKKILSSFFDNTFSLKNSLQKIFVSLVYRKSEGILLAKKLDSAVDKYQTESTQILNVVNKLEPKSEIINSLPFYYKQLFIGKNIDNSEFVIPRDEELKAAERAVLNFRNNYGSALLILGDRFSGKTTLSKKIANKYFDKKRIFVLNPLEEGSCKVNDLEDQISKTFHIDSRSDEVFSELPQNSVIIIDDLELWWERTPNGFSVLEELGNLIEIFSSKIFFIVNINQYAFKFINRIYPLGNIFIQTILCQPFNAEEIEEAILMRHKSSGMKLFYDKQTENQISQFTLAKLFNSYFDVAQGNIGISILMWISNITGIKDQQIYIKKPSIVKTNSLTNIKYDWKILLQQFIFHKHLTNKKIQNILFFNENESRRMIQSLVRNGLLSEFQKEVYCINPYLHNTVLKMLSDEGLV